MWENAEVVTLLDRDGYARAISRNEQEAPIRNVVGLRPIEAVLDEYKGEAQKKLQEAMSGDEAEALIPVRADAGYVFWCRVRFLPTHIPETPVMLHVRRLPRCWGELSPREQEMIHALHKAKLNPKRAARELGITQNTLNAHRRTICQKCNLTGVGDFWVFVERCR